MSKERELLERVLIQFGKPHMQAEYDWDSEYDLKKEIEDFLSTPEPTQDEEPAKKPAPPNSLPSWDECRVRVSNSDFIAERIAEGGYGGGQDTKLATALHRFIYEYDDADPFRSGWFLHRLEQVVKEHSPAPRSEFVRLSEDEVSKNTGGCMRHKYAEILHAYAEGEEIQARYGDGDWINIGFLTHPEHEYRIKPKKVKKEGWLNIYSVYGSYTTKEEADKNAACDRKTCIRIEWEEEE